MDEDLKQRIQKSRALLQNPYAYLALMTSQNYPFINSSVANDRSLNLARLQ